MLNNMLKGITKIYIAYGITDFRKQIYSLCNIVQSKFNLDPYTSSAFIFCNRKRNSIKVLCYDKNGFVLAQKTLVKSDNSKFQWPKNKDELNTTITAEQLRWLLSGLKVCPDKYFKEININKNNIAI